MATYLGRDTKVVAGFTVGSSVGCVPIGRSHGELGRFTTTQFG